jgi:hypothetical protein
MSYEPEVFRPARPVHASRRATAEDIQGYVLDALRGMPCALSIEQVADKVTEDWVKITPKDAQRALRALVGQGQVEDKSNGAGTLWARARRA